MAALVTVLAFFFMPGNDSSNTMRMRVRVIGLHDRVAQVYEVCPDRCEIAAL